MLKVHVTDRELGAFAVHCSSYANFFLHFWATAVFGCALYNDVTLLCLTRQQLDQKYGSQSLLELCYRLFMLL